MEQIKRQNLRFQEMLSDTSFSLIQAIMIEVTLPKYHLLIDSNRYESNAYIVVKGIVRSYILKDGKDISYWFAREGDIINSSYGYASEKRGYENYELLEESILYQINIPELKKLYLTNIEIANWSRVITEMEAIKSEQRFLSYMFTSPLDRYLDLLENDIDLLQRVSLKDIASFLGISAVSLSRIRARIK